MEPLEDVVRELGVLVRALKALHPGTVTDAGVRIEMAATGVLFRLHEQGRMRPSALADALHLDLSSISRQVAALEREGWVSRERDPADSRAALLELTGSGADVLQRVRTARVAQLRRLLPGWSPGELADLADTLHRLNGDLSARPGPGPADLPLPPDTTDHAPALAGQETA